MDKNELLDRLLDFGARSISVAQALPKSDIGRHVALQLARSATSAGANYSEACAAESRRDFVHKTQVVAKELREAEYWMKLIVRSGMLREGRLRKILRDAHELISIFVASVKTAKSRKAK